MLTPYPIQHFRHCGYLVLSTRMPVAHGTQLLKKIVSDRIAEVDRVVLDLDSRIVRLSALLDRNPVFERTAGCSEVIEPLKGGSAQRFWRYEIGTITWR